MNPFLAMLLTSLLPLLRKQVNADLFRFIEHEIENKFGFDIPGDRTRELILQDLDSEFGWTPILIATPQWLFNLTIYAVKAKWFNKREV
jgi:hypothetical protein